MKNKVLKMRIAWDECECIGSQLERADFASTLSHDSHILSGNIIKHPENDSNCINPPTFPHLFIIGQVRPTCSLSAAALSASFIIDFPSTHSPFTPTCTTSLLSHLRHLWSADSSFFPPQCFAAFLVQLS